MKITEKLKEDGALFFSAILVVLLMFHTEGKTLEPITMIIFIALIYFSFKNFEKSRIIKRKISIIGVFSFLLAIAMTLGQKMNINNSEFENLLWQDLFWQLLYFVAIFLMTYSIIYVYDKIAKNISIEKERKETIWVYMLIIIGIYLLFWILYWPGIVAGDSLSSIKQIEEGFLENHHPVFYTCIIGVFLKIGEAIKTPNLGISLYCLFQIIVCAFSYSYFLVWLGKKRVNKLISNFALLYFIISPVMGVYSVTLWKDPMFVCALLFLIIDIFDICESKEKVSVWKWIRIICMGILSGLLRNNGIYILIFILGGMYIGLRKYRRELIVFFVPSIIVLYFITGPFYENVLNAHSRFVEKIGIPLQQMARVVVEDGEISDTDAEFLYSLLPKEKYEEYYDPYIVDPIKWSKEFDTNYLNDHKKEFFVTWISMLKKNFGCYVEQYLMGTVGFWRIGEERNNEFVKLKINENPYNIYENSLLGEKIGGHLKERLESKYARIPMGLYVWSVLFDVMYCILKKKYKYILPLLPIIGNWGTLLVATPTAFGLRYIWINVVAFPLLIIYPIIIRKRSVGEKKNYEKKLHY